MKNSIFLFAALFLSSSAGAQCTQKVFASYSPGTVCATRQLNLYANTIAGATYSWTGPAGFTSTAQNPVKNPVLINMSGNYIVTATAGTCIYKDTVTILVNATPPQPSLNPIPPVCKGGILNFGLTTPPVGTTYSLWGPGGIPIAGPIYNITSANNGIYKAVATYTNTGCTSDTGTSVVTVTVVPPPALSTNAPVCYGDTLELNVNPQTAFVDFYYWDIPTGVFVQSPGPLVIPSAGINGYYKVANIYNSCLSDYDSVFVTFTPLIQPQVYITSQGAIFPGYSTMTFNAHVINGGTNPAYQWFRNGIIIGGATADTYTGIIGTDVFHGDDVYVTVQRDSACGGLAVSDTITLNVDLAVNSVTKDGSIQLYPNPNNGHFTVNGSLNGKEVRLEIINTTGQVVYTENVEAIGHKWNKTLDLGNQLPAGVYQLRLVSEQEIHSTRFIINK